MKTKMIIVTTGILGALAVAFGAFGAHALKDVLSPEAMSWYQTANHYHFVHVLAILGSVSYLKRHKSPNKNLPNYLFMIGLLLFSGSLYSMAFISIEDGSAAWLGPVTPVGGLFFIMGWVNLAFLAATNE